MHLIKRLDNIIDHSMSHDKYPVQTERSISRGPSHYSLIQLPSLIKLQPQKENHLITITLNTPLPTCAHTHTNIPCPPTTHPHTQTPNYFLLMVMQLMTLMKLHQLKCSTGWMLIDFSPLSSLSRPREVAHNFNKHTVQWPVKTTAASESQLRLTIYPTEAEPLSDVPNGPVNLAQQS